jgi:hypothetical protein
VLHKKLNSLILFTFHVLVFIAPLVIKGLHEHAHESDTGLHLGTCVEQTGKPCVVCNYEFVSFDQLAQTDYSVLLPWVPIDSKQIYCLNYSFVFTSYSGRAPPVLVSFATT